MKTLTTLTAIAALFAGLSVASAQTSPGGSMGNSGASSQRQAIGNARFCIATSASGALNCKYASLAACEQEAKPQNLTCTPNPNAGTTGSQQ